jgi:hypothetical protein
VQVHEVQVVDDVLVQWRHVRRRDRAREESPWESAHIGQIELPGRLANAVFAARVEPEHDQVVYFDHRMARNAFAGVVAKLRGPALRYTVVVSVTVVGALDLAVFDGPQGREEAVHVGAAVRVNDRLALLISVGDEIEPVQFLVHDLADGQVLRGHEQVPSGEVPRELPVSSLVVPLRQEHLRVFQNVVSEESRDELREEGLRFHIFDSHRFLHGEPNDR